MKKSFIQKIARSVEKKAARIQGKGWGAGTVEQEFEMVCTLMSDAMDPLLIDIGGNKGHYTSAILNRFPSSQIVVFEPASVNQEILRDKFASANVVIEPFAVSNMSSTSTLYSDRAGSGLASLSKRRLEHFGIEFEQTEDVSTIRFEDYWNDHLDRQHIHFCKLDIEGHELLALDGFGEAINHIDLLQFEFGGCNIDTRTFFQDFWYFFTNKNFEVFRMTPFGLSPINSYSEIEESFLVTNFLARKTA